MRIRRALVPVLLATVATLTACGGGDSGGQAADDPTSASTEATEGATAGDDGGDPAGDVAACDLLTTDEVADAVGSPVKDGIRTSGPAVTGGDFTTCVWQSADPDNPADTATLTIYENAAAADSVRSDDSPGRRRHRRQRVQRLGLERLGLRRREVVLHPVVHLRRPWTTRVSSRARRSRRRLADKL